MPMSSLQLSHQGSSMKGFDESQSSRSRSVGNSVSKVGKTQPIDKSRLIKATIEIEKVTGNEMLIKRIDSEEAKRGFSG